MYVSYFIGPASHKSLHIVRPYNAGYLPVLNALSVRLRSHESIWIVPGTVDPDAE